MSTNRYEPGFPYLPNSGCLMVVTWMATELMI